MDEQALRNLAGSFQSDLCPAPPGADVVAWLRAQVERLQPLGVPPEVGLQILEESYMEWVGDMFEGETGVDPGC